MYTPNIPAGGLYVISITSITVTQSTDWLMILSVLLFVIVLALIVFRFVRLLWKENE